MIPSTTAIVTKRINYPAGVDISCTKRGASFRGDKASREQVSLKLIDMVEIAEAHELGKPHWATSEVNNCVRRVHVCRCAGISTLSCRIVCMCARVCRFMMACIQHVGGRTAVEDGREGRPTHPVSAVNVHQYLLTGTLFFFSRSVWMALS